MIILELFAGSRSIGKAAEAAGHTVISCDIDQFGDIDIVGDGDTVGLPFFTYKPLLGSPVQRFDHCDGSFTACFNHPSELKH